MQQIDLMSTNRRPENDWNAAEHDQKSTRSAEYHDECIQHVSDKSPGLFVWKCVDIMKVWWVDRQTGEQPNEWTDKPIPMPMAYMTSSIFGNPGQIMVLYPITIKLLFREVLVSPWSRYDGILCEITQLHVIKNVAWTKAVIFMTSSNSFYLKSLSFKFHWIMILIAWLMISQHWFSQACRLC